MHFTKRLREPVMAGQITCSIRIWQKARVTIGGRYALGPGHIEVTEIREIDLADITEALAIRSGFPSVAALMSVAKHGPGERVFLVEFEWREDNSASPWV